MTQMIDLKIVSKIPEKKIIPNPLIFVHGMFQGSWVWEKYYLDYFSELGYECHAINLRGHNGSPSKGWFKTITIGDYVEDLKTVIDSFENPPVVIAHSMGGFITQKYLESHQLPLTILLASVGHRGVIKPTLKVMLRYPFAFLWGNLTWNLYPIINSKKKMKKLFFMDDTSDAELEEFHPRCQNEAYIAYLGMLLFSWFKPKKVKSPLVFIGAEKDWSIKPFAVIGNAKQYGLDAKIFPDHSHCMMLDKNWKDIAEYIHQTIQSKL